MRESRINKRALKKMGYIADQQGIINRYLREGGGWDSHLLRCREYIIDKAKGGLFPNITILGSGWLLDVPLEELSAICENIYLIDIRHPAQVRKMVQSFNNVHLLEDDISGGMINRVWKESRKEILSLDSMEVALYNFEFDPGLVVSLNILTQTDTLLIDYLSKKSSLTNDEYRKFRKRIQKAHLDSLKTVPHIIITDFEESIIEIESGKILETNSLLFTELPQTDNRNEWDWDFDNSGEYYRRKRVSFKVVAIDNSLE